MRSNCCIVLGWTTSAVLLLPHPVAAQTDSVTYAPAHPRPATSLAVARADSLYYAMQPLQAYDELARRLDAVPTDVDAGWRAAFTGLTLALMEPDAEERVAWLRSAQSHAERVLDVEPGHPEALTWLAGVKGRLAMELEGRSERIELTNEIWSHTGELIDADSTNAFALNIRGKMAQEVQRLSGLERFFARRMYGGGDAFRDSSWEQSERDLRRALERDPGVVFFYLDLGETLLERGKREEATAVFEKGLTVPDRYPSDAFFRGQIRRELEELGRPREAEVR